MEGITYNPANNTLLWVDIILAEVHRISLDNEDYEKTHEVLKFAEKGESVGAIALTKDNDVLLLCTKYGVCKGSFQTKQIEYILKYPVSDDKARRVRSNDGTIDPWGNLWIGVMNDFPTTAAEGVQPEGCLYRIDAKTLEVKQVLDKTLIANGLAFSEDGTKFYWTDSLTFTLWLFDLDPQTGTLSNRQPVLNMKEAMPEENSPEPDGLAMLSTGHIFHAVFSTRTVLDYTTDGKIHGKYVFPAERLTCTCLGGPDDNDLFVTTGHLQLDNFDAKIDATDKTGDLGGYLFRVKLPRAHGKPKVVWGGQI